MKELRLRPRTEADLIERTRHCAGEGGPELGERFFDAAIAALEDRGEMPCIDSPGVGELAEVPTAGSARSTFGDADLAVERFE